MYVCMCVCVCVCVCNVDTHSVCHLKLIITLDTILYFNPNHRTIHLSTNCLDIKEPPIMHGVYLRLVKIQFTT